MGREEEKLERFHPETRAAEDPRLEMAPNPSGDWVLWDDAERSIARLNGESAWLRSKLNRALTVLRQCAGDLGQEAKGLEEFGDA